ncbi:MAG: hotdog fold domain-containing protein [Betaproteobacteria bacterium]
MSQALTLWNRMRDKPLGKWLFSRAICWKAPYFGTIAPRFEELKPGYSRVSMKKRRAVQNHIGTVHAIAACNLAELAAGTMMEAGLPASMRWLPKGMSVQYLKKCETDLIAEAIASDLAEGPARNVPVSVDMRDTHGNLVVHAVITMYVSPRKTAA